MSDKGKLYSNSRKVTKFLGDQKFFGRMNDPTSSSYIKGACGDSMEFYLVIEDGTITDIKYYTDGCDTTKACAAMTAHLAKDKTINDALLISAGDVIQALGGLPGQHLHCSILSVSTLYRALASYLLSA